MITETVFCERERERERENESERKRRQAGRKAGKNRDREERQLTDCPTDQNPHIS